MKTFRKIFPALTLGLVVMTAALIVASCNEKKEAGHEHHVHATSETYSCPMHPSVTSEKPGSCPVCGMDLVKATRQKPEENSIMLSDAQIKLANIKVQRIRKSNFGQSSVINGRLAVDPENSEVVASRIRGRIDKLFIKENGQEVQKGQPLYTLFSEELLTLKQEYLLAKEQFRKLGSSEPRYKAFADAAERKLLLYGLSRQQVGSIDKEKSLTATVTMTAPAAGIVTEIVVTEGQYVGEGSMLFRIENLNPLWVEAELFPHETPTVRIGDKILVSVAGDEGSGTEATVNFISPELRANTQIITMRSRMPNPRQKLKPGQQVNIRLYHSVKETLTVPVDAVIRSEKGQHLYILNGRNTFEPRLVKTGIEDSREVEITEGIKEGDTVAVSGAYLLYSEMVLRKGVDPVTMNHTH